MCRIICIAKQITGKRSSRRRHSQAYHRQGDIAVFELPIAEVSACLPSQAEVLTGGRDMREAQVDVPLSVSHTCVWSHSWAL